MLPVIKLSPSRLRKFLGDPSITLNPALRNRQCANTVHPSNELTSNEGLVASKRAWVVLQIRVPVSVPKIVRHPNKWAQKETLIKRTTHMPRTNMASSTEAQPATPGRSSPKQKSSTFKPASPKANTLKPYVSPNDLLSFTDLDKEDVIRNSKELGFIIGSR